MFVKSEVGGERFLKRQGTGFEPDKWSSDCKRSTTNDIVWRTIWEGWVELSTRSLSAWEWKHFQQGLPERSVFSSYDVSARSVHHVRIYLFQWSGFIPTANGITLVVYYYVLRNCAVIFDNFVLLWCSCAVIRIVLRLLSIQHSKDLHCELPSEDFDRLCVSCALQFWDNNFCKRNLCSAFVMIRGRNTTIRTIVQISLILERYITGCFGILHCSFGVLGTASAESGKKENLWY